MAMKDRGFASMDREKQRDIASQGGRAAHEKGSAHEWTSDEARAAGRKGGMASKHRADAARGVEIVTPPSAPLAAVPEQFRARKTF